EMIFPQIGVHQVAGSVALFKTVFHERAKHPVLLVHAVEESANVTVPAEIGAGTMHGTAVRCHTSPPAATSGCQSRADASEQIILLKELAQPTEDVGGGCALPNAVASIRRDEHGWN